MLGRFKTLALLICAGWLTACGPRCDPTCLGDFQAWPSDAPDAACASGLRLKLTGLCTEDAAANFLATTPDAVSLEGIVWRTADVPMPDGRALVFRARTFREELREDLDGKLAPLGASEAIGPVRHFDYRQGCGLHTAIPLGVAVGETCAVEFLELAPGQTAEDAALARQASRIGQANLLCRPHPRPDLKVAGSAFALQPFDAVDARGVPLPGSRLCGGPDDIWEARPGYILRHELFMKSALDPASYTIYARGADGIWRKSP